MFWGTDVLLPFENNESRERTFGLSDKFGRDLSSGFVSVFDDWLDEFVT